MNEIIFATNNANKVNEIKALLPLHLAVISLAEAGIDIEIEEPYHTLHENALEKATVIYRLTKKNCFSEDTGLFVDALDGAPGVRSARYSGENADNEANIHLLLQNLDCNNNRTAHFKTVICLLYQGNTYYFEGICNGEITEARRGEKGFGYDAVFVPTGGTKTFAEMDMEEKSSYSHRKKATAQLIQFFKDYNGQSKT